MATVYGNENIQRFLAFADSFLKGSFEFNPMTASNLGLHEYDGKTPDLSKEAYKQRVAELDRALDELNSIDTSGFDPETRLDYRLLKQGIEAERFKLADMKEHTYSPMPLLWLTDVTNYIKRDYAPIEERVRKLIEYERGIPRLVEQGIALMEPPLARPIVNVGVQMFSSQADYMRNNLPETVSSQVSDQKLLAQFNEANSAAAEAIEGLVQFMKDQLVTAKEDFAIGADMFHKMLAVNEMVDLPLEQVLAVGRDNLQANKEAFIRVAKEIAPEKSVQEVAAMMADKHPTADGLIPETADMLDEIRQYLIDESIITVPSDVRCKVRETPEFMRWGFAFMDSPGPFEERATDAYYYVTPVEKEWSGTQQEEWLRRFNYPTLRDVSIHEAYPGHYVHFLHAAQVMSPIRKVFGSYSFVEGWAHYCEQMMVEEGYRGDTPMLHFAQLSEALLRNCRYVTAILMHTGRMTLEEATRFFMDNAFIEELPAQKEALRGTFDPGFLNYTLGKLLLLKLREDVKAKEGDSFNLKGFHDRVLALGYPPVPLVREHLLGDDSGAIM